MWQMSKMFTPSEDWNVCAWPNMSSSSFFILISCMPNRVSHEYPDSLGGQKPYSYSQVLRPSSCYISAHTCPFSNSQVQVTCGKSNSLMLNAFSKHFCAFWPLQGRCEVFVWCFLFLYIVVTVAGVGNECDSHILFLVNVNESVCDSKNQFPSINN